MEVGQTESVGEGFTGFRTIGHLFTILKLNGELREIPDEPGNYCAISKCDGQPEFVPVGGGDPVPIEVLKSKWVNNATIIYVGQTSKSLKRRITDYMRFGQGQSVGHHGGRYIWQIRNFKKIIICWRPLQNSDEDPREIEEEILREFEEEHGRLPFANLKH